MSGRMMLRERGPPAPMLSLSEQLALVLRQPAAVSNLVLLRKPPTAASSALQSIAAKLAPRSSFANSSRPLLAEIRGGSLILYPITEHLTLSPPASSKPAALSAQLSQLEQILDFHTITSTTRPESIIVINIKHLHVNPNDKNLTITLTLNTNSSAGDGADSGVDGDDGSSLASGGVSPSNRRVSLSSTRTTARTSGALRELAGRKSANSNSKSKIKLRGGTKNNVDNVNRAVPGQPSSTSSPSASLLKKGKQRIVSSSSASLSGGQSSSSYAMMNGEDAVVFAGSASSSKIGNLFATTSTAAAATHPVEMRFSSRSVMDRWAENLVDGAVKSRRVGLCDFEILRAIGKGAGGQVFLVKDAVSGEHLALKVMDKSRVANSTDSYRHAVDERLVMELACNHPFILRLRYAFQTELRLYLVTDYCEGGDLFEYMRRRRRPLSARVARRVVAQILLALQHIHSLGAIYRDLKLENILLDDAANVRVADFGLAKMLEQIQSLSSSSASSSPPPPPLSSSPSWGTTTFCGTREYVSPEMLRRTPYGTSVDVWALGILLYELVCGKTPFYSPNRDEVYLNIESAPLSIPPHVDDVTADLITRLLERDVAKRIGSGAEGVKEIMKHAFFDGIAWDEVLMKVPHPDDLPVVPTKNDGTGGGGEDGGGDGAEEMEEDDEVPAEIVFDLEEERRGMMMMKEGGRKDTWGSLRLNRKNITSRSSSSGKKSMIAGYGYTNRFPSDSAWSSLTARTEESELRAASSRDSAGATASRFDSGSSKA